MAHFGRLDVAFNNAGVQNQRAEIADSSSEDYDCIMNINLRSVYLCMKYQLQTMREQDNGAIINCSSLAGLVGAAQSASYTAAKHGIIGLGKSAVGFGQIFNLPLPLLPSCPATFDVRLTSG